MYCRDSEEGSAVPLKISVDTCRVQEEKLALEKIQDEGPDNFEAEANKLRYNYITWMLKSEH